MKRINACLRFFVGLLFCFAVFTLTAGEWYVMVEKAELHSKPDINSPVVGYVCKSDSPVSVRLNTDGSWALMKADDSKAEGWAMTCVCKEGNNNSYGFDYETCYKINKEWAKGEISQELFAQKLSDLQNNIFVDDEVEECGDEYYEDILEVDVDTSYSNNSLIEYQKIIICAIIVLWLLSIGSFVVSLVLPKLKITGLLLLLLGVCELIYVLFLDTFAGLSTGTMINYVVMIVIQLFLLILNRFNSSHKLARIIANTSIILFLTTIVAFVWRYGVGNFFMSLFEAIIGIILIMILVAVVRMIIKAPPSIKHKKEPKKEEDNKYETCNYCRNFDYGEGFCNYHRANRSAGDSCNQFRN